MFIVTWFAAELFAWPKKIVWIVVGIWAAKDALLYPLVWRAYEHRDAHAFAYPAAGAKGIVLRRLDPDGTVRIGGERWNAVVEGDGPIEAGERVRVVGRDGMTLVVAADASAAGNDSDAMHVASASRRNE
ncbi:MAG TPA: NfeD family protein [Gammaproteobacteria bacterium]